MKAKEFIDQLIAAGKFKASDWDKEIGVSEIPNSKFFYGVTEVSEKDGDLTIDCSARKKALTFKKFRHQFANAADENMEVVFLLDGVRPSFGSGEYKLADVENKTKITMIVKK